MPQRRKRYFDRKIKDTGEPCPKRIRWDPNSSLAQIPLSICKSETDTNLKKVASVSICKKEPNTNLKKRETSVSKVKSETDSNFMKKDTLIQKELTGFHGKKILHNRQTTASYAKRKVKPKHLKKFRGINVQGASTSKNTPRNKNQAVAANQDQQIVPRAIFPKHLRPIVIDGTSVAIEHGRVNNTFSGKGIEISINYFLKLGHTNVTAFVPHYRRCKNWETGEKMTDASLIERLARSQHVVFTPSRKLKDGKEIACDDERLIVECASSIDGIILSNKKFEKLMNENKFYSETIAKRLLMFCFVGDRLMIPKDPLGRHGPLLDEFLSFPSPPNIL